ncbi:MAG: VOC family protein [Acidimicrobiia bacterium]
MTALPDAQLTHVGVLVDDMDAMVAFYTQALGLLVIDSGEHLGRHLTFMSRNAGEHHQLVLVTGRDAPRSTKLLGQISFRVAGLGELRRFHAQAQALGAGGLEARNHGNSWSIYFEDPEGNRIEMYCTTPWHVPQPWRVSLDLTMSDADIAAETLRIISAETAYEPVEQWREQVAARLAAAAESAAVDQTTGGLDG